MNAPLDLKMDKATFLRWVQKQQGRWELVGGRPVLQDSATRDHGTISKNFERALDRRLNLDLWSVWRGEISVEVGDETRAPDVMVEPAGLPGKLNATDQPVLLVEVLSPSSGHNDFHAKPNLYFQLPSLEAYIVASQDTPCLWTWQRSQGPVRTFPDAPAVIDDAAGIIQLVHLDVTIPMAEIYRGFIRD